MPERLSRQSSVDSRRRSAAGPRNVALWLAPARSASELHLDVASARVPDQPAADGPWPGRRRLPDRSCRDGAAPLRGCGDPRVRVGGQRNVPGWMGCRAPRVDFRRRTAGRQHGARDGEHADRGHRRGELSCLCGLSDAFHEPHVVALPSRSRPRRNQAGCRERMTRRRPARTRMERCAASSRPAAVRRASTGMTGPSGSARTCARKFPGRMLFPDAHSHPAEVQNDPRKPAEQPGADARPLSILILLRHLDLRKLPGVAGDGARDIVELRSARRRRRRSRPLSIAGWRAPMARARGWLRE